jgi:hypothetical protein
MERKVVFVCLHGAAKSVIASRVEALVEHLDTRR